jgi:hypothetical protein
MRAGILLAGLLLGMASAAGASRAAEPVDNCASLLGSLSVELRAARALPPGRPTTFKCPREWQAQAAIGASARRVRAALGPPDRNEVDAGGGTRWVYRFASRYGSATGPVPELAFHLDATQAVTAVDCARQP